MVLAKEMATLDVLSGGRFLPGVGLGIADPPEQRAFGVQRTERGRRHDEALELMRRCWTGEVVSHRGEFYSVDDVQVLPRPAQDPFDVWLGGAAAAGAPPRRPSRRRVAAVVLHAPGRGRRPTSSSRPPPRSTTARIDPSTTARSSPTATARSRIASSSWCEKRSPGSDPRTVIPKRRDLPTLLGEFVDAGASKFVVMPLGGDADPDVELGQLAEELLPLET